MKSKVSNFHKSLNLINQEETEQNEMLLSKGWFPQFAPKNIKFAKFLLMHNFYCRG